MYRVLIATVLSLVFPTSCMASAHGPPPCDPLTLTEAAVERQLDAWAPYSMVKGWPRELELSACADGPATQLRLTLRTRVERSKLGVAARIPVVLTLSSETGAPLDSAINLAELTQAHEMAAQLPQAERDPLVLAWARAYKPAHNNVTRLSTNGQRCFRWSGDVSLTWCRDIGVLSYVVDRWGAVNRPEVASARRRANAAHPGARLTRALFVRVGAFEPWRALIELDGGHILNLEGL